MVPNGAIGPAVNQNMAGTSRWANGMLPGQVFCRSTSKRFVIRVA